MRVLLDFRKGFAGLREGFEALGHEVSEDAEGSLEGVRLSSFFASNGSLTVNGGPPAVGRAAIAVTARGFMTAFPDLQVLMAEAIDLGERALYRWTLIGTNTGPGGTGHAVRISGYEEWRLISDGLIAESLGHFDAADYERQLAGR